MRYGLIRVEQISPDITSLLHLLDFSGTEMATVERFRVPDEVPGKIIPGCFSR